MLIEHICRSGALIAFVQDSIKYELGMENRLLSIEQ